MPPPSSSPGALADQGVELVKLVCSLSTAGNDAESLRLRCDQLLSEYQAKAQKVGVALEYIESAKYAWVALIDEKILASELPIKDDWLTNPLQMKYFDSFSAGEDFYTRMETYRHTKDQARVDVLEVYLTCLAMGFSGKLGGDGRGKERRKLLLDQLANEIAVARDMDPAELSPRWSAPATAVTGSDLWRWKGLPVWAVPLLVIIAAGLVWFACTAWVGTTVDGFTHDFPAR
jgi:type VI secretion system protein ImpK